MLCGCKVCWAVVDVCLHVIPQDLSTWPAVDDFQLREGLDCNPEINAPANNCRGMIGKGGYRGSACFIDKKQYGSASCSLVSVIGGCQLVEDGSPQQPDKGCEC